MEKSIISGFRQMDNRDPLAYFSSSSCAKDCQELSASSAARKSSKALTAGIIPRRDGNTAWMMPERALIPCGELLLANMRHVL